MSLQFLKVNPVKERNSICFICRNEIFFPSEPGKRVDIDSLRVGRVSEKYPGTILVQLDGKFSHPIKLDYCSKICYNLIPNTPFNLPREVISGKKPHALTECSSCKKRMFCSCIYEAPVYQRGRLCHYRHPPFMTSCYNENGEIIHICPDCFESETSRIYKHVKEIDFGLFEIKNTIDFEEKFLLVGLKNIYSHPKSCYNQIAEISKYWDPEEDGNKMILIMNGNAYEIPEGCNNCQDDTKKKCDICQIKYCSDSCKEQDSKFHNEYCKEIVRRHNERMNNILKNF